MLLTKILLKALWMHSMAKQFVAGKCLKLFNALLGRWKLDEGETIAEALKPMISNVLDARALPCKLATAVVSSPSRYFI